VYIARPFQFPHIETSTCNSIYWSNKRFSQEVIDSMNEAVNYFTIQLNNWQLNTLQLNTSSPYIHLIGYSGGATVAELLTSHRCLKTCDVASIRTLARNLNTELLNQALHISVMPESLNPINMAKNLQYIPQIHFIVDDDQRVSPSISASFIALQSSNCAVIVNVKHADHKHGWAENWTNFLQNTPKC